MSDASAAGKLRAAADSVDDARDDIDLDYKALLGEEFPDEHCRDLERLVDDIDDVLENLDSLLRTVALLAEDAEADGDE